MRLDRDNNIESLGLHVAKHGLTPRDARNNFAGKRACKVCGFSKASQFKTDCQTCNAKTQQALPDSDVVIISEDKKTAYQGFAGYNALLADKPWLVGQVAKVYIDGKLVFTGKLPQTLARPVTNTSNGKKVWRVSR